MAEAPVVDASPLIYLSRTGDLGLLTTLSETILVPAPVVEEIRVKGSEDPAAMALATTPFLQLVGSSPHSSELSSWELGSGESSVLAWAIAHPGSTAIIDDLEARRCARSLGIPYIGTLGILLQAKRDGWIPAARPVLERLITGGMYLSTRIMNEALALVNE